jgi:GDP-4-dehydro-6-deoxy-D-mannose reductase
MEAVPDDWRRRLDGVSWASLEMMDLKSVMEALGAGPDAVIHLAAVSSGAQARQDPLLAWQVNCVGTYTLVYAMEQLQSSARLVFASTGEVYGAELTRPAVETDPVMPISPYAASKAAAEHAVMEFHRRTGADVIVARPFAQAGPGQGRQFVVSAFIHRILDAKKTGADGVSVGNLDPVREFLDVRDVSGALALLAHQGDSGGVYNIAAGSGVSLRELFELIAQEIGWAGKPVPDPELFRRGDVPYVVGDGGRVADLGWQRSFTLQETIRDAVESVEL